MAARAPRSAIFPDRLPPAGRGLRVGLLGGSFDPPHAGHRAISLLALRRLRLDAVWWLVSPGNPLKPPPAADLWRRLAEAAAVADHPRIAVTGIEAALGARYTVATLARLMPRLRNARPIWIMGADNLATFHRWRAWRRIAASLPLAVADRPGASFPALAAPAAHALARFRLTESRAARLAAFLPPAWVFLHGMRLPVSSTALRARDRAGSAPEA